MLAIRPTFSESWYRVADLRVKLRASAQISRQHYRGERWYVVRDPAGNQFHRLSDAAYRFVGLLDGSRTVEEAWELCGGQLADDAPTQPEVIQILSHLYAANLVDADVTPDATVLLRRHKQQQKKKLQRRLMNVLFPRIPIWDPDRFLTRWMPIVEKMFSKVGALVWLVVIAIAVATITPEWAQLKVDAAKSVDLYHNTINVLYMYMVFVFVKLIHELGHAFACRRFGGECHELGIMLLILVPTPYVDASTAWAFSNKWQRVFVGAAGMIVELFFAALCAFVWRFSSTDSIIHQLSYNAMLIASVTTLIFNANPLLRYDGYYIMSDFLEIPNLRQKSTEYALGLIKRHIFRVKMQQPLPPVGQRIWLLGYAIASSIYRVFVSVAIMLMVAFQLPVIGLFMAIGMVITFVVVPVVKVFKYLTIEPELHRKRGRAIAFCSIVAGSLVLLIGLIRFPYNVYAPGVVDARHETIRAGEGGFVSRVLVKDGEWLHQGAPIVILSSETLEKQINQAESDVKGQTIAVMQAMTEDPTKRLIEQEKLDNYLSQLEDLKRRRDELTIKAPFDGVFVNPAMNAMDGKYIGLAQPVGMMLSLHEIEVRAVVEQRDKVRLVKREDVASCQVRLASNVDETLHATDFTMLDAAQPELVSAAVGTGAGGDIAIDPKDPKGTRAAVPQFEVRVTLANPDAHYLPGQRATVRFQLKEKYPLIAQWSIRFWQLIQTKSAESQW